MHTRSPSCDQQGWNPRLAKHIDCKRTAARPKACPQPLQPPVAANSGRKHAAGSKMPGRCSSDWARAAARVPFEVSCADCRFFLDPAAQAPGPFSFGRRGGGRQCWLPAGWGGGRMQRKTSGLVVHLQSGSRSSDLRLKLALRLLQRGSARRSPVRKVP